MQAHARPHSLVMRLCTKTSRSKCGALFAQTDMSGEDLVADVEIAGGDDDIGAEPTAEGETGSTRRRLVKKSAEPSVVVEAQETAASGCYVCDEPIAAGSKSTDGHEYHIECWNGVRSLRNMVKNDPDAKATENELFRKQPAQWKKLVQNLVVKPGTGPRTNAQRNNVKERIVELISFRTVQRRGVRLMLTKRRYKSYYRFWEGMDSDEAGQKFDADVDNGVYTEENASGETMVAVADNARLEEMDGRSVNKRLRERDYLADDAELSREKKRLRAGASVTDDFFRDVGAKAFREGKASARTSDQDGLSNKAEAIMTRLRKANKQRGIKELLEDDGDADTENDPASPAPAQRAGSKAQLRIAGPKESSGQALDDEEDEDAASVSVASPAPKQARGLTAVEVLEKKPN